MPDEAGPGESLLVGVAYAACLTLFVLANRLTTAASTIYLQSTAPLYLLILGSLVAQGAGPAGRMSGSCSPWPSG